MKEMIRFYNRVQGTEVLEVQEIPEDVYKFLIKVPVMGLVTPFIVEDLEKGDSELVISRKYMIGRQVVRRIKKEHGF